MMIDSHAHCHFNAYKDDMDEVIKRSLQKETLINLVGTQKSTSESAVRVAEKYDGVYASIGLHPEHLFSDHIDSDEMPGESREADFDYEFYKQLGKNKKVIGIGECGLDLYRIPEKYSREEVLAKQIEVFNQHIKLSRELELPLVIHSRDAHPELIHVLKDAGGAISGTMHCYTSNWENAEQYLKMGLHLGFTGVITFPPKKSDPKAQEELIEVVRRAPLDRILIETDCPYLSPIPYRGKRGEPWMVEATALKIAEIRGISISEVLNATTENAKRLFRKMA